MLGAMRRDTAVATSFDLPPGLRGILPSQWLQRAVEQGAITSERYRIPTSSVQPASGDLRLRCSFLPEGERIEAKLSELSMGQIDLRDGAILERNRPYLIPIIEELDLPPQVAARTNPPSSTARLDTPPPRAPGPPLRWWAAGRASTSCASGWARSAGTTPRSSPSTPRIQSCSRVPRRSPP